MSVCCITADLHRSGGSCCVKAFLASVTSTCAAWQWLRWEEDGRTLCPKEGKCPRQISSDGCAHAASVWVRAAFDTTMVASWHGRKLTWQVFAIFGQGVQGLPNHPFPLQPCQHSKTVMCDALSSDHEPHVLHKQCVELHPLATTATNQQLHDKLHAQHAWLRANC